MPFEVQENEFELHAENKFYFGDLLEINEEEGNFGPQLKWIIALDEDGTFTDDDGTERPITTWAYCGNKLTTNENNKFRKYVKSLTGKEPVKGEVFDEQHWTKSFYDANPDKDPEALTGRKQPWRVAVMFEHAKKKSDGSTYDKVTIIAHEDSVK